MASLACAVTSIWWHHLFQLTSSAVIEAQHTRIASTVIRRASKFAGPSFEIPEDFDVRDWRSFLSRLGQSHARVFAVPCRQHREFSKVTLSGAFLEPDDTHS